MSIEVKPDYDAIVIGAGITGIYQAYLLDQAGVSVLGIEAAEDVGGTWFWNRYPGCRLDTESYAYGYFALSGIIPDWDLERAFRLAARDAALCELRCRQNGCPPSFPVSHQGRGGDLP
jgi:phytoene dehydrogenase-like protein